jgi:hypothetical protein
MPQEFLDEVLSSLRSYAYGDPQYIEILSPIVFAGSYSAEAERRYVYNVVYSLGYKPRVVEEFKERNLAKLRSLGLR